MRIEKMIGRRGFLIGLGTSLVAAPAMVRAATLMPVRGIVMPINDPWIELFGKSAAEIEREIFEYGFEGHVPLAGMEAGILPPRVRPRDMEKFRREMAIM